MYVPCAPISTPPHVRRLRRSNTRGDLIYLRGDDGPLHAAVVRYALERRIRNRNRWSVVSMQVRQV